MPSRLSQILEGLRTRREWVIFLFYLSGFAALIYQIVWQRLLFTAFGVNIESVTIIVSIFMLGLGLGALVGGRLSQMFVGREPRVFLVIELLIGGFGALSVPLIERVTEATIHLSMPGMAAVTFALLCIPTMLMGATLPVLVSYLNRQYRNVGRSVALLYAFNTLGSATACFVTALVFFSFFGLRTTAGIAAALNVVVGLLVYQYGRDLARKQDRDDGDDVRDEPAPAAPAGKNRFGLYVLLSAALGYISLSQEILWVRALSFAAGSRPEVFPAVLGCFLLGVTAGSLVAARICHRHRVRPISFIVGALTLAATYYFFALPLVGAVFAESRLGGWPVALISVVVVACLTGGVFPVLCHQAVRDDATAGRSVSWLYLGNIIGACAGPLFTGFVLLDHWSLTRNINVLTALTVALAVVLALVALPRPVRGRLAVAGSIAAIGLGLFIAAPAAYDGLLERLQLKDEAAAAGAFAHVVENRAGVITVSARKKGGDVIYGGGVYDGRFNVDPIVPTNGIGRAYMMAAVHPDPKRVLMIGLSSGSWARAVLYHGGIERLTIVEINPGYDQVISRYPEQATLLDDPRVSLVIDDGRRWLRRHPELRFDVVYMNTTYHWRSHATALLSREFLTMCKARLRSGGVMAYNTTKSPEAVYTAAHVFPHVSLYAGLVLASDRPVALAPARRRAALLRFRRNGVPLFDPSVDRRRWELDRLARFPLPDVAAAYRARRDLLIITDDNMATEYKTGGLLGRMVGAPVATRKTDTPSHF